MFHVPERFRVEKGMLGSTELDGNNGYFIIPFESYNLAVVASDGMDWDHVSVSLAKRTPNWREMCFIKDLFWDEEDCIVQYHPAKSEYVNMHENCLHLWRNQKEEFKTPPSILVGIKK